MMFLLKGLSSNPDFYVSPPLILELKYNVSSQGVYLQLDPVSGVDKYSIQTFNCSGGMLQEVKINSTCSAAVISNAEVPDTGVTLIAVQNCIGNSSCGDSADIDSKNIVAINFSDPSKDNGLDRNVGMAELYTCQRSTQTRNTLNRLHS